MLEKFYIVNKNTVGWFIVSQTKKKLRDWDVNTVAAV